MNETLIANKWNRTTNPAPHPGHTQKHPGGYLTPILKKILSKKIKVADPEVAKILQEKYGKLPIKKLIMLRYALNAIQGENQAIEGILDRMDGKLKASNENGQLIKQLTDIKITIVNDGQSISPGNSKQSETKDNIQRQASEMLREQE